jgi:CDP-glucose 4,6-dehydratase
MAAQPLVRASYIDPIGTYATNVMGTVHLLDSIKTIHTVRAVVVVTTDKCYENREWVWGYRETDPMGGYDPYSSSKGCAELVTAAYRQSFFNPSIYERHRVGIASARAGNVIGGGDWSQDRLMPDIFRAIKNDRKVRIRNPESIRPWQHVLEPLYGYLTLAKRLVSDGAPYAEAYNFGPREESACTVGHLTKTVCNLWGDGAAWEMDEQAHPHEANYLKLDISKAGAKLEWIPLLKIEEALQLTVDWTKAYLKGVSARSLMETQIREYEAHKG